MKKKIWALIVCCALILICMIQLVGCTAKDNGAENIFKKYVEAQKNGDKEAIIALVSPDQYDYMLEVYSKEPYNCSEEEAKKMMLIDFELFISDNNMNLLTLADGADMQEYFDIEYELPNKYVATEEEVRIFNEHTKNEHGFDEEADKIVLLQYIFYAIDPNGEKVYEKSDVALCMQVGDEWYMACDNDNEHAAVWRTTYFIEETNTIIYSDDIKWIRDKIIEWY